MRPEGRNLLTYQSTERTMRSWLLQRKIISQIFVGKTKWMWANDKLCFIHQFRGKYILEIWENLKRKSKNNRSKLFSTSIPEFLFQTRHESREIYSLLLMKYFTKRWTFCLFHVYKNWTSKLSYSDPKLQVRSWKILIKSTKFCRFMWEARGKPVWVK